MEDFLVIDAIRKRFGNHPALDGVSLQIREGEVFSLLGPSGCGKTTLLRLIAGFDSPDSGQILLQGRNVAGLPPEKRPVNTVFQNYALFPHLSIRENIAFGPKMAGWARSQISSEVARMLALVKMEDQADKLPSQISGGQKQRVAIARALVNKPRVLLLDEPLAALDLKLRQHLLVELAALHREVGTTFVYVTHDQAEAMSLSHRIAVMNAGRVEQVDVPESLYRAPRTPFVASFIGDTNLLAGSITGTSSNGCKVTVPGLGVLEIRPETPITVGDQVTLSLRPEDLSLTDGKDSDPSLVGVVDEVIYFGAFTRYWVTSSNQRLLVQTHGKAAWARGDAVRVAVDPGTLHIVEMKSSVQ
ncbi:MAG: ABC transporter ATP-binding protein [Verrucomicrobiaceae bacterium]|nr:ABC transporter ATP-binding protein [Verrucomicrobiaceae bacterium]